MAIGTLGSLAAFFFGALKTPAPLKGHVLSRTAVCNAPCNERGGPRYDMDDGAANSAFTSGLRSSGAQDLWSALVLHFWFRLFLQIGGQVGSSQKKHIPCQPGSETNRVDLILAKPNSLNCVLVHRCPVMSCQCNAPYLGYSVYAAACRIMHLRHPLLDTGQTLERSYEFTC